MRVTEDDQPSARRRWMARLAQASRPRLEAAWAALPGPLDYKILRAPQIGLVMVRGRAGGTGRRFNLGEMTVTRAAVRLADAAVVGHGYVAGRDRRHAELAAVFDALLQAERHVDTLHELVLEPVAAALRERREAESRKAAATRVEFFTLAREA